MKITSILTALLLSTLFVSCVKDDLVVANTNHPETAQVVLNPSVSGSFLVQVGNQGPTLLDTLYLQPGSYHLLIYSSGFSVNNRTLTVGTNPSPGIAYSGSTDRDSLKADRNYHFDVPMQQLMRQVSLTITDTGSSSNTLQSISATLSGIAPSVVLETGAATGNATTVAPINFTPSPDKLTWTASAQLIDVRGTNQVLTMTIIYTDGSTDVNQQQINMTGFGSNKTQPFALSATIRTATDLSPNVGTSVSPWEVESYSGDAEEQPQP